ncbi:MAG: hypothetical protein QNL04_02185 [SAR324 cluster bacterium]|nr:hypothetical protein [SAR324 cluster bacterium]
MKTQDEKLGKRLAQGLKNGLIADKYNEVCPDDATFFEFTEASLNAAEMEECQLHLAQCAPCRETYSLLQMPETPQTINTKTFWANSWKQMTAVAAALILFAPGLYQSINPDQPLVLETMESQASHDFYAIIYLDDTLRTETTKSLASGQVSSGLKTALTLAEPELKGMNINKWTLTTNAKKIVTPKYLEVYVTAGKLRLVVAP